MHEGNPYATWDFVVGGRTASCTSVSSDENHQHHDLELKLSKPPDLPIVFFRELPTVTTGGTSDEPVQNRGPDLWRRAPAADMKVDINTIQSNITSVDTMLADLQKMVLPKNMTRNQSVDLNTKIEKILNIVSLCLPT